MAQYMNTYNYDLFSFRLSEPTDYAINTLCHSLVDALNLPADGANAAVQHQGMAALGSLTMGMLRLLPQ